MTRSGVTLCWWKSPASSAGYIGFYVSRKESVKQSGWPGNPVDHRIWRLMQDCVYIVQDTCPQHQRLDAAHQWHTDKHITKRRSCWSMEKAVVCTREGKRTSLWTCWTKTGTFQSQRITQPALFRATNSLLKKRRRFSSFPLQLFKNK